MITRLERFPNLLPNVVRCLAMGALAIGLGVWVSRLWAPAVVIPPALLAADVGQGPSLGAVARWFGGGESRVKIAVVGVMAGGQGYGSALLAVNDATARAYRSGDTIVPGVLLESVWATHLVIDQDGRREQLDVKRDAVPPINGFIPVP